MPRLVCWLILMLVAIPAYASSDLSVSFLPAEIRSSTDLGVVEIEGVGAVTLIASKSGNQLIVHARSPSGDVIGKAESVVGLRDTPIYVMTSNGLKKITIYWGAEE